MAKDKYIENIDEVNFRIWGFMTDGLGLHGAELLVYAVIYSFSSVTDGEYRGSVAYLARLTACNERTVGRALSRLTEEGYIKKSKSECASYCYSYRVERENVERMLKTPNKDKKSARQKIRSNRTKNPTPHDKMSDDNSNDNKEITTTTTNSFIERMRNEVTYMEFFISYDERMKREMSNSGVKYQLHRFGHDGGVYLTVEQYAKLRRLVSCGALQNYIFRLEDMIEESEYTDIRVHSHYKTLKKWITEDLSA